MVAWLKVNPLRDSILDFLTEVSNRHCRLAIYFPLKDVIDGFDYELLNSPEEGIQRHMTWFYFFGFYGFLVRTNYVNL